VIDGDRVGPTALGAGRGLKDFQFFLDLFLYGHQVCLVRAADGTLPTVGKILRFGPGLDLGVYISYGVGVFIDIAHVAAIFHDLSSCDDRMKKPDPALPPQTASSDYQTMP